MLAISKFRQNPLINCWVVTFVYYRQDTIKWPFNRYPPLLWASHSSNKLSRRIRRNARTDSTLFIALMKSREISNVYEVKFLKRCVPHADLWPGWLSRITLKILFSSCQAEEVSRVEREMKQFAVGRTGVP